MDKNIKYIILENLKPIIFSHFQQHKDFRFLGNITSAGFVDITKTQDECGNTISIARAYGKSISLNLSPVESDHIKLTMLLNPFLDKSEATKIIEKLNIKI